MDWQRVVFTEHMTEAAAVVGECQVVLDFSATARATYEIKVLRVLKGTGAPYFAIGRRQGADDAFRPVGDGDTPETALQACLEHAGIHLRRHERRGDPTP
jgi:hypothetical protein